MNTSDASPLPETPAKVRANVRTGADYLNSLGGRRIFIGNRLVEDPGVEPSFAAMAGNLAGYIDNCGVPGPLQSPDGYPAAYMLAKSQSDVMSRGAAFEAIARQSGGMLGRSPDFLATILTSWRGASKYFGPTEDRLISYWEEARARNLVLTHAISDPPTDRYRSDTSSASLQAVKIVESTNDGIIVDGAKMLATLAPFADELLVYPFRPLEESESDQAILFAVPLTSPGLTLFCRPAYANGEDLDHPLASRFDEMDAIVHFENVLVPWNRVFIHADVGAANGLRAGTGMTSYAWHQSAVRAWVKAEFILELAEATATASNRMSQQDVKRLLGELAGIVETLRALVVAAQVGARRDNHQNYVPDSVPLGAAGMLNATLYPRAVEILQIVCSSGLIVHPLSDDEGSHAAAYDFYEQYFGAADGSGPGQGPLLRAAADVALDRFGARQVLYERVFLGPPEAFKAKFFEQYLTNRGRSSMLEGLLP